LFVAVRFEYGVFAKVKVSINLMMWLIGFWWWWVIKLA